MNEKSKKIGRKRMNFDNLATEVIKYIGGKENIAGLTHCATRLRFTLNNQELADEEAIKEIKGVLGVAKNGGQFQIIIGNQVPKAYEAITAKVGTGKKNANKEVKSDVKFSEKIFDFIASIFTPILPAIIGAGLVKSVLALAVLLGMNDQSNTYYFINIIGDAPLYFLPMMLAVTASKKLECNSYMAVAITGALLHPNYTALIEDAFSIHFSSMFGIPVTLASYSSSVIPVILMVFLLKYVDKFLDKFIPQMIKFFFKPLLTLLIVGTLTFIVLGPIGFVVGVGISTGLNFLSAHVGWLVPTIVGAIFPLMVTAGMHYGIVPFMLQSISAQGFEQICGPGNLPSNIAQGAASLAVAMRTKKSDLKQMAFTSGATALLGVTEPALFSVTLKYKKVLSCVMIGGGFGGLYAGITGVKCFSFCSPGLLSMVAFVGKDGWANLINACISMAISFAVTFLLVWFWGYKDENKEGKKEAKLSVKEEIFNEKSEELQQDENVEKSEKLSHEKNVERTEKTVQEEIIVNPVDGEIVSLKEVPDATFAEEMLGKGFAVIPEDNKFYAPVSGTVGAVFPTGHAIGITSETGAEILIHIGLDTVKMDGEGFKVAVTSGQEVKQGDLLVECDLNLIKENGYNTITPVLITNPDDYKERNTLKTGKVNAGEAILQVKK